MKQGISLFKLQETAITAMNKWAHQFVKDRSKHERDGAEAVKILLSARPPTVSDLKQALKWKMGNDAYRTEIETAKSEKKAVLLELWRRIETSPCQDVKKFDAIITSNPSFENTLQNISIPTKIYEQIPPIKELCVILKRIIGESKLKELI